MQNKSELAEQHAAGLAMLTVQARSASQTTGLSTHEHAIGRNKQHREHAEWLLTIPSHHRTASGSKISQRKVLPSTGKRVFRGCAVSRAPEGKCWVTGGGMMEL